MIIGIGTDIIEIERIKQAIGRTPQFLNKIFTEKERAYFEAIGYKTQSIAGNFAAKEAISKAFGTGFRLIEPKDIEVLRDEMGKPSVTLYKQAYTMKEALKISQIHLSISHCKSYAIAFATLERSDRDETCY